jgi:hypothetical protein
VLISVSSALHEQASSASYAITDVTVYTMDAANRVINGGNIIVENGMCADATHATRHQRLTTSLCRRR